MNFDHDINVLINRIIAVESPYFAIGMLKSIIVAFNTEDEKKAILGAMTVLVEDKEKERRDENWR